MLKKLLIAAVAVVVGLAVVNHTRLGSVCRLNWHKATAWAQKQVPIETEIERLQMELANLSKNDGIYFDKVARQEVQALKLEEEIKVARTSVDKQEQHIQALRKDLTNAGEFVVHNGERFARTEVMDQLQNDWKVFQSCEEALKHKQGQLKNLQEIITANRNTLKTMQANRTAMANKLAKLRLEYENLQLAKARSEGLVDQGDISGLLKGIEELDERLSVEKRSQALKGEFTSGRINTTKVPEKDILKEIDAHFEQKDVVQK
jgi:hypothetical protein